MKLPLRIRTIRASDVSFICSSWLRSYRNADAVRGIPNNIYYGYHHKLLDALLTKANFLLLVDEEHPDSIVGWLCYEMALPAIVVHYAYVKYPFRRMGLLHRMMEVVSRLEQNPAVVIWTHRTRAIREPMDKYGWVYNPYLLYELVSKEILDETEDHGSGVRSARGGSECAAPPPCEPEADLPLVEDSDDLRDGGLGAPDRGDRPSGRGADQPRGLDAD